MSIITTILLAVSLFLCGTIAGMSLVHKMYEKTIDEQQDLIETQEQNNSRILCENIRLYGILEEIQGMSDYTSGKHIKDFIEKKDTR